MDFHEYIVRYSLRHDYVKVARMLNHPLDSKLHLEFAFFIMKNIVNHRNYTHYSVVRELAKQLSMYKLPWASHERDVCAIERAAAYIVLMKDLISINGDEQAKASFISSVREFLPDTNRFKELDAEVRKSRVTLLAVIMKEHRISRLQYEFNTRAEKISKQIKERLENLQNDLLPQLEDFSAQKWAESSQPEQVALSEIVASNGVCEESLLLYYEVLQNTPSMSADFFRVSTDDIFAKRHEESNFVIID
ncbi:unnamed protein product [Thelazia callipaeda]|uniref:RasGEF domain protein n=1 Tax=Thelazia callipaeda TaxID=103827 RepID=A0A0N5D0J0_THECL|nr:unnamed protein product [Thelazia callipaeda]